MTRRVVILGATGSIGQSTLDILARHPENFELVGATAHRQTDALARIAQAHRCPWVAVTDPAVDVSDVAEVARVLQGEHAAVELIRMTRPDIVVAAIVGAAGLLPALEAVKQGCRVLLANKESLVMAGELFMAEVARHRTELLPVDSEHNAIFQALPAEAQQLWRRPDLRAHGVRGIVLTASGGPFRGRTAEQLGDVTPAEACAHPNWSMGRKISVDSATLMNKGLELIEACWLFGLSPSDIDVHIHPQSIVHSAVRYLDGSVVAQLGAPDMRTPIAYGLAWPDRLEAGVAPLDLFAARSLTFETPEPEVFRCLPLAARAFEAGGVAPAVLNAANEVAVEAFLNERIGFLTIAHVLESTLEKLDNFAAVSVEAVLEADDWARRAASEWIAKHSGNRS